MVLSRPASSARRSKLVRVMIWAISTIYRMFQLLPDDGLDRLLMGMGFSVVKATMQGGSEGGEQRQMELRVCEVANGSNGD